MNWPNFFAEWRLQRNPDRLFEFEEKKRNQDRFFECEEKTIENSKSAGRKLLASFPCFQNFSNCSFSSRSVIAFVVRTTLDRLFPERKIRSFALKKIFWSKSFQKSCGNVHASQTKFVIILRPYKYCNKIALNIHIDNCSLD